MKFQITDKGQYFPKEYDDYTRFPYAECAVCSPGQCVHVEPFPICLHCLETWIADDRHTVIPGEGRGRQDSRPIWPDLYGIQEVEIS